MRIAPNAKCQPVLVLALWLVKFVIEIGMEQTGLDSTLKLSPELEIVSKAVPLQNRQDTYITRLPPHYTSK